MACIEKKLLRKDTAKSNAMPEQREREREKKKKRREERGKETQRACTRRTLLIMIPCSGGAERA
eukprot:3726364-Rhodomonas_salina.3